MTTPIYAFPYPVLTDPPNGAAQIQALAEAVETTIDTLDSNVSGDITTLANPARAQLRTTVAQACANNTDVAVQFDLEDFDSANGHSTVTNNSRYTSQVAGTYLVAGGCGFNVSSSGNRVLKWAKNGVDVSSGATIHGSYATNTGLFIARTMMIELAVSDYVQLIVSQNSGGSLNTTASGCYMSVLLIRNNSL